MKRALLIILAAACLSVTAYAGIILDPQVWGIPSTHRLGNDLFCVLANNVSISQNLLTLTALWTPNFTCPNGGGGPATVNVTSGAIFTQKFRASGTLRVDVRMKASGLGVHTTVWLLGVPCFGTFYVNSNNCPPFEVQTAASEIDVAEFRPSARGNTTEVEHFINNTSGTQAVGVDTVTDYSQNFHTYSAVYTQSSSVTYWVDGVQTFSTVTNIPTGPMFLAIDQEIDSSGGTPSQGLYPQTVQVVFIRACTNTASACAPGNAASGMVFDEEFTTLPYSGAAGFSNAALSSFSNTAAKGYLP